MKYYISILLVISFFTGAAASHSIVLVHLGEKLPTYISDTLFQARLFNPSCEIVLLANQEALDKHFNNQGINIATIAIETLTKTLKHKQFIKKSALQHSQKKGNKNPAKISSNKIDKNFWFYASERFFYLDDYIKQYNKSHVFHIENDVMLYVDLEQILPVFKKNYPGIAAIFDCDDRCIPSLVYLANEKSTSRLMQCFVKYAEQGKNDMQILAILRQTTNISTINSLPIIMDSYCKKYSLKNALGYTVENPTLYSKNITEFQSIFDAAALGQFLGGIDPRNGKSVPGFINERCIFNPSHLTFKWIVDHMGRKVPYMIFGDEIYRINNLHIHSKKMGPFLSLNQDNGTRKAF